MPFRLGIGSCSCRESPKVAGDAEACHWIATQRDGWRARLPEDLTAIPQVQELELQAEGRAISASVHRHALPSGGTLVVWSAFVHTWARPTYLSLGAVGRLFSEGLIITGSGEVKEAPDEAMWEFR